MPGILLSLPLLAAIIAQGTAPDADLRKSVVNISVKQELRSPTTPWKRESPQGIGGSGVVIAPGRILTNAHVVTEASEIMIETPQTPLPIQAQLLGIDPTRDLALLGTDDADFIAKHPAVGLLEGLPKDGSRVTVMGFPMGGDAMSTTSGVISRTEWAPVGNRGENGMRIQVDAAVNSGNSGGPAFGEGKIVGLAFSGLDQAHADNISYLIATEEIQRFLDQVAVGAVEGNTVKNIYVQTLENPALRAKLGAGSDVSGVVVIDQKGGPLQPWDIVTRLNGSAVDNKGQITIEGDRKVSLDCAVGRFVISDTKKNYPIEILRQGKPMSLELPAYTRAGRVIGNPVDGEYPYLLYGPLAFSPLSMDLIDAVQGWMVVRQSPMTAFLNDDRPSGGKEFVAVASPLLSNPVARGYEVIPGQTVKSVNGKQFNNFAEFVAFLRNLKDEYVVFEFNEERCERIVLRRADIEAASERVMESNGIRRQCSKDIQKVWEGQ
ncbi:MAG: serine protease [Phycisphaerales bacterium]|nr:serine protease [Phycisphaerales bacterium]